MNRSLQLDERLKVSEQEVAEMPQTGSGMRIAASAVLVNRVHRVVHERAKKIQAERSKRRSLWIPIAVSGGLLAIMVWAVWTILDEYELEPTGLPDANQQMLVLMMWILPVSAMLLGVVLFRRNGSQSDNRGA